MKKATISFDDHASGCDACGRVDVESSSSLSKCCFVGAGYLMDKLSDEATKVQRKKARVLKEQFVGTKRTTIRKLQESMVYADD